MEAGEEEMSQGGGDGFFELKPQLSELFLRVLVSL